MQLHQLRFVGGLLSILISSIIMCTVLKTKQLLVSSFRLSVRLSFSSGALISQTSCCHSMRGFCVTRAYAVQQKGKDTFDATGFFPLGNFSEDEKDKDSFLFGSERVTFSECGVHNDLTSALSDSGKIFATTIQIKTIEAVREGKDVVIGSETGSGKTLAYLIPIFQRILNLGIEAEPKASAVSVSEMEEQDQEGGDKEATMRGTFPSVVIMCPNKELTAQVYTVANDLASCLQQHHAADTKPVTVGLYSQQLDHWPHNGYSRSQSPSPDIAICTPAFLSNYIRGPNILEPDLFRHIKQLVLDEADMLLDGSYVKDIEKILEAFKLIRRDMIKERMFGINDKTLQTILVAATLPSYGLRSIEQYINKRFPEATRINNDYLHKHHPRIKQQFTWTEELLLSPARIQMIVNAIKRRSDEIPETKEGDSGEAAGSGELNAEESLDAIEQTMVFVNTAESARVLAEELTSMGIVNAEYHKLIHDQQKQVNLAKFRASEIPVLICTDHAARGLDLPNVRHVLQAEFALNVVQYLHRIGRASRAGVRGRATNIYDHRSKDLVDSILSDSVGEAAEKKIDQSFSRRRGFRQKLKKAEKRAHE